MMVKQAELHPAPTQHHVPRVDLLVMIYYAWANREPGRMQVWVRKAPR